MRRGMRSRGCSVSRALPLLDEISGCTQGGGHFPGSGRIEISQLPRQGHAAVDAAVGVLRPAGLNGNVETIDARDRAETAGPFAGLRHKPRADFDRIGSAATSA
jgi:hypothetical protein